MTVPSQRYAPVPDSYDDEALLQMSRSCKCCRDKQKLYRRIFMVILAINLLVIGLLLFFNRPRSGHVVLDAQQTPSPFGNIPMKMVRFEHDHSFDGNPLRRNSPWNKMNPPGRGFIVVQNPEKHYNLAPGTPLDQPYRNGYVTNGSIPEAGYLPSVFHQLHCMALLKTATAKVHQQGRDAFQELRSGQNHSLETTIGGISVKHLDHCIEYVRQALMCAGDTTLEPAELDDDGNLTHSSSGWGTEHLCRSWEHIYDYSFEHRVSDVTGITG